MPALPTLQKRRRVSTPPVQHQSVDSFSSYVGDNGYGADAFSESAEGQPDALLPSFFRVEPYDEMQKKIGDWIWAMSKGHQHIEVRSCCKISSREMVIALPRRVG